MFYAHGGVGIKHSSLCRHVTGHQVHSPRIYNFMITWLHAPYRHHHDDMVHAGSLQQSWSLFMRPDK